MTSTRFSQALGDVSKAFKSPQEIVAASDLDRQQKIDLLKQWEMDLRLLMVASEENMGGDVPGGTGELLQAVLHCLEKLGASQRERQKAPTKSGG
jgi:hypothetical protein